MALSDYQPIIAWFADSLADLDIPTGTTKGNPGTTGDPTLTGSPDSYADFDGTQGINFLPASPVGEVGSGDFTIVMRARVDTFNAGDVLWENYDGSGTSQSAVGLRIKITAGGSRRIGLVIPPSNETTFVLDTTTSALTAGQDFIIAFRRSSDTMTIWLDVDGSGGMVAHTPNASSLGTFGVSECGTITIGTDTGGGAENLDGRIYWALMFDEAISDTDIQLSDWDTESNLKTAWLGGSSETTVTPTTGLAVMSGGQASVNPFSNVRIRDTLINEAGSPVGNRTGIHLMVWYAGVPSGAPDLSYSSMTSDANGTISWSIATGSLVYNQNIFYVAHDGNASGSLSQYTCARMIPNYE